MGSHFLPPHRRPQQQQRMHRKLRDGNRACFPCRSRSGLIFRRMTAPGTLTGRIDHGRRSASSSASDEERDNSVPRKDSPVGTLKRRLVSFALVLVICGVTVSFAGTVSAHTDGINRGHGPAPSNITINPIVAVSCSSDWTLEVHSSTSGDHCYAGGTNSVNISVSNVTHLVWQGGIKVLFTNGAVYIPYLGNLSQSVPNLTAYKLCGGHDSLYGGWEWAC